VHTKPITAPSGQLMHNKYVVRDVEHPSATVWTGSANFTDDAWTHQENNLLTIASSELASAYRNDFDQLWSAGTIEGTGAGQTGNLTIGQVQVGVDFAPGDGTAIDAYLAAQVAGATGRIVIASMLLTSHPLLAALVDAVGRGVEVSGIYDAGQMDPIAKTWAKYSSDAAVLQSWQTVSAHLVGKHSAPYRPTGVHDFMHNKVLVADDQLITGSYNLSANAEHNAENQLHIHDKHLADQYAAYVNTITEAYRPH
jgi:phosphatidylserine/phosphatidylglycerophosphate/cardiolipin synthase-like enzyme